MSLKNCGHENWKTVSGTILISQLVEISSLRDCLTSRIGLLMISMDRYRPG
jgi:hypothetical protein